MGKKSNSKFGNTKLEVGFTRLLYQMSQRFSVVLKKIANNRGEEVQFGRFLKNSKVTPEKLIGHQWEQSSVDFSDKHLLVLTDTCVMSLDYHGKRGQLGQTGSSSKKSGFKTHPALLLDADHGGLYGLGAIKTWEVAQTKIAPSKETTKPEETKVERKRKPLGRIPFSQKETYTWYEVPKKVLENCPMAKRYTVVGDCEADIYDLFVLARQSNWDFVYRCKHNRTIEHPTFSKLSELLASWTVNDCYDVDVSATKKRSKHKAKLELKFGQVTLKRPTWQTNKDLPKTITVYVVEAKENPQTIKAGEQPVHWIIFTSHVVETVAQATTVVNWYKWRWTIEQLFRTVKSKGLDIEHSRLETPKALANLATLALLAAVHVMQMVQARNLTTQQDSSLIFSKEEQQALVKINTKVEGKTILLKNPYPPQSLAFATWVIARLGGWSGYLKQPPPGPITILNGLIRFYDIMWGVAL